MSGVDGLYVEATEGEEGCEEVVEKQAKFFLRATDLYRNRCTSLDPLSGVPYVFY